MKDFFRNITLITLLCLCSAGLTAQLPLDTLMWEIETTDGNTFIGKILQQDDEKIMLKTEAYGTVEIPRTIIRKMVRIKPEELVGGEFYFYNPHASRYFFGPNGYGLKKGEGYYQNTWILFNQVSYGLHDYFSLGVGMLPLFLFAGAPTPLWITPKVQFPVVEDKVNMGAGLLAATIIPEGGVIGITYGVVSLGSRDHNLSAGLGWGFSDGGWADVPTFSLSGMTRISVKTFLMTENYFINTGGDNIGIISLGGRTVQRRLAVDYGLIFPLADIGEFIAIPWLGITVPFGNTGGIVPAH